jgi:hypothetical protein
MAKVKKEQAARSFPVELSLPSVLHFLHVVIRNSFGDLFITNRNTRLKLVMLLKPLLQADDANSDRNKAIVLPW